MIGDTQAFDLFAKVRVKNKEEKEKSREGRISGLE
jgi:hypothetical protein